MGVRPRSSLRPAASALEGTHFVGLTSRPHSCIRFRRVRLRLHLQRCVPVSWLRYARCRRCAHHRARLVSHGSPAPVNEGDGTGEVTIAEIEAENRAYEQLYGVSTAEFLLMVDRWDTRLQGMPDAGFWRLNIEALYRWQEQAVASVFNAGEPANEEYDRILARALSEVTGRSSTPPTMTAQEASALIRSL